MSATPTPDDAARTLRDFEQHRQQATIATGWPLWSWIGGGILVAVLGVLYDLNPGFAADWGSWITGVLLLLAVLSTTRWGSALFGRPARVRRPPTAGRIVVAVAFGALVAVLTLVASRWEVPHLVAAAGVAGGLLMAIAGPLWQRHTLSRPPALS
ncbi:hypothetical protein [Catenuloplanes japonicus]|uniref:hypothetical protein n=1 Tax=Catenuloplanes japonicus TaxID=33876 RepID=UPI00052432D9|nr:hypothetical protein [Catenuloplanes japonicus]